MSAEIYECPSCGDIKPESEFHISKLGQRNPICKECRRVQRLLCRKLEKLGYKFTPSSLTGNQRDQILKKFRDAEILSEADIPWQLSND